jgi:hypothetical protein
MSRPEVIMVRALFLSMCLSAVVLAGCGSTRPETADCENYVENFLCPAIQSCPYSTYASFSDCVGYFETVYYQCGSVFEGPGLSVCEYDTSAYSCAALFPASAGGYTAVPPNSCVGVFY